MKIILVILFSFFSSLTFGQISVTNTLQVNIARGASPLQVIPSGGGLGYFDVNGMLRNTNILSATTGMSFSNMTTIGAVRGIAGGTVFVRGFGKPGDGGGGLFYWDDTATSTAKTGLVLQVSGVPTGRWKRTGGEIVDIRQIGAVGDGVTDNTVALNYAASLGKTITVPSGTYLTNGRINFYASGARFIGEGRSTTHIVGGASIPILLYAYGASNIEIAGIDINNSYSGSPTATHCFTSNMDTTFDHFTYVPIDSNLYIHDCRFTGVTANAIEINSSRSGFGGRKHNIRIINNLFEYLGGNAVEILGAVSGSDGIVYGETMWDMHIENNRMRHLGLVSTNNGFACSFSGPTHGNTIVGNYATDYKTIGFELAGVSYTILQGNKGDSTTRNIAGISTCFYTVNAVGSPSAVGNRVINNISIDSTPSAPYIINQRNLVSSGNSIKTYDVALLMDSVGGAKFEGDRYVSTSSNGKPTLYIRNGSNGLTFHQTDIVGSSSQNQLVLMQNRSVHIKFDNCFALGNTSNTTLVNQDASCSDITGIFNSALRSSTNYIYGLPTAGQPTFDLVLDSNGVMSKVVHGGGVMTKVGNYVYPAIITDSLSIGGVNPLDIFSIFGKESSIFNNLNNTPTSRFFGKSLIVQQSATGGTSTTLGGINITYRVAGGDTIGIAPGITVNFDNFGGISGIISSATGFRFTPGNLSNILGISGMNLDDGGSAGGYTGIFSGITTGTNKYFINHNGTAPSIFNGAIGIGEIPAVNSLFDVQSTTKGSLPFPRMTNTQRDALSASEGLTIYSLTDHTIEFFNGSVWKQLTTN